MTFCDVFSDLAPLTEAERLEFSDVPMTRLKDFEMILKINGDKI